MEKTFTYDRLLKAIKQWSDRDKCAVACLPLRDFAAPNTNSDVTQSSICIISESGSNCGWTIESRLTWLNLKTHTWT